MKNAFRLVTCALMCAGLLASPVAGGATSVVGNLPRASDGPVEALPGVDTEFGVLQVGDDTQLRTIVTRPTGARGRLPAVLFVQWLSCDSIELRPDANDGWSAMLRSLITGPVSSGSASTSQASVTVGVRRAPGWTTRPSLRSIERRCGSCSPVPTWIRSA